MKQYNSAVHSMTHWCSVCERAEPTLIVKRCSQDGLVQQKLQMQGPHVIRLLCCDAATWLSSWYKARGQKGKACWPSRFQCGQHGTDQRRRQYTQSWHGDLPHCHLKTGPAAVRWAWIYSEQCPASTTRRLPLACPQNSQSPDESGWTALPKPACLVSQFSAQQQRAQCQQYQRVY